MAEVRKRLIAGNWKMNGLLADALRWAKAAAEAAGGAPNDLLLLPPYPWLLEVGRAIRGSSVLLGAQACHAEPYGAFTGSVSAAMLKDAGCSFVLAGHSERRRAGETDERVAASLRRALESGLHPILCVGETREERDGGRARTVVLRQVSAGLDALRDRKDPLTIAYEPVWAIGAGTAASPSAAAEAHGWIRRHVQAADADRAAALRILYGGSGSPANMGGLLAAPDVDGFLVGGASLDPEAFRRLARAVPEPPDARGR
jgi:triosephosphate isomerase